MRQELVALPLHETAAMHEAVMTVIYKGLSRTNTDELWQAYLSAIPTAVPPVAEIPKTTAVLPLSWQPIETAPKDGVEVLLCAHVSRDIGVCYWRDDDVMTGWTWGLGKSFKYPSHWMPLPTPPTSISLTEEITKTTEALQLSWQPPPVTKCGECPKYAPMLKMFSCPLAHRSIDASIYLQNKDGITPTCPMWQQQNKEKTI
jgi:hypothetical protein